MYTMDVKTLARKADDANNTLGKSIAKGVVGEFNYVINQHFSLALVGGHFFAGNYIINTGKGENNTACSFRFIYKF
jgi:hypothetical protein